MDKFWELFAQSMIIQGVLALMFAVVVCIMYVNGQTVPAELVSLVSLILGYFFGAKNQAAQEHLVNVIRGIKQEEI